TRIDLPVPRGRARAALEPRPVLFAHPGGIQEGAELPAARGMAQLPQGFGLNLPDAFPGHGKTLPDFLQRVLAAIIEAKPHLDYLLLARRQRLEHRLGLL